MRLAILGDVGHHDAIQAARVVGVRRNGAWATARRPTMPHCGRSPTMAGRLWASGSAATRLTRSGPFLVASVDVNSSPFRGQPRWPAGRPRRRHQADSSRARDVPRRASRPETSERHPKDANNVGRHCCAGLPGSQLRVMWKSGAIERRLSRSALADSSSRVRATVPTEPPIPAPPCLGPSSRYCAPNRGGKLQGSYPEDSPD